MPPRRKPPPIAPRVAKKTQPCLEQFRYYILQFRSPASRSANFWCQRLTVRANGCNAFDCNCRARDRWLPREPRDAEQLTERLPKIWLP